MNDPERLDDKGNESSPPEPREDASEADSDESASQFLDALRQILAELGIREEDPRLQILVQRVQALTSYHGPIPPPHMLAEYESVRTGLADLIVNAWQEQTQHRKGLEQQVTTGSERRMDRSQRNAFILGLFGLAIAGMVGIWGHWLAAALIALVSVGGPNTATVLARYLPTVRQRNTGSNGH